MSKRTTPKAKPRKPSSRKPAARKPVGNGRVPTDFSNLSQAAKDAWGADSVLGQLAASAAASQNLSASIAGPRILGGHEEALTGEIRLHPTKPRLSNEDILTAHRLVADCTVPTLDEALAVVRREVYGYTEPFALVLGPRALESVPLASQGGWDTSKSYSYNGEATSDPAPHRNPRATLPDHVFQIRKEVDVLHAQLQQLVFTLEPVLKVGPRHPDFQRPRRPVGELPPDSQNRDATLTCSLDSVAEGVADAQVLIAFLIGYLALDFQAPPTVTAQADVPPGVG
jgi:hypothetical protein